MRRYIEAISQDELCNKCGKIIKSGEYHYTVLSGSIVVEVFRICEKCLKDDLKFIENQNRRNNEN